MSNEKNLLIEYSNEWWNAHHCEWTQKNTQKTFHFFSFNNFFHFLVCFWPIAFTLAAITEFIHNFISFLLWITVRQCETTKDTAWQAITFDFLMFYFPKNDVLCRMLCRTMSCVVWLEVLHSIVQLLPDCTVLLGYLNCNFANIFFPCGCFAFLFCIPFR